ncbi:hypothetical protein BOTBODRAFT_60622 [Botryobasidium botryosum FD-172 SS1]|uniref:Uncharacterized protein n=1 Tax=Botryobasidium botryosum (strain FD-172 SS1) TaxID=930990 RepID=A0A067M3F7_BOTB1|nr:hypothetical protein BOTBODRAFT_60622 [Botryobasidium botryosum FD-172 SS1]
MAPAHVSSVSMLRALYPRAARAFLQRDVASTHALITNAFLLLTPPVSSLPDALASHRRQWDILRITFETSLYSSPTLPSTQLPSSLAAILNLSAEALLSTLYIRSLALFTPSSSPSSSRKPDASHLPAQILVVLAYAALKLESPQIARDMVEDWLALRPDVQTDRDEYERVVDVYCLHILPRLKAWDYALDFITYDAELGSEKKESVTKALQTLRAQPPTSLRSPIQSPLHTPTASSTSPSRTSTPILNAHVRRPSSPSSSISSASTHTAVPLARRAAAKSGSTASDTPAPLSHAKATPNNITLPPPSPSSNISTITSLSTTTPASTPAPPRRLLQVATYFPHYLRSHASFVFLVLLPLFAIVYRYKAGRQALGARVGLGLGGTISMASWFGRAVWDTIRMGGQGLV